MSATTTTLAYALKRLQDQRRVQNVVYKDNPFFALVKKKGQFEGSARAIALRYGDTSARSSTFSTTQTIAAADQGASKGVQFLLTRVADYASIRMTNESILAAKSDLGAFLETYDQEFQGALNAMKRSFGQALYGSGSGAIGRRASISTNTITLTEPNDVTNFEVGDHIEAAATETGAIRSGSTYVTVVNRASGTITVNSAAAITSFADSDYLFKRGDAQNGGTAKRLAGLEAWNPSSAPSSTAFFGVDRSVDAERLGGMRLDISALNPEEGLVKALHISAQLGDAEPGHLFLNPVDVQNIHLALGSKAVTKYMQVGDIGFSTIVVTGPRGDTRIMSDRNCPKGIGRLVDMSTWTLHHLGQLINIISLDGADVSRVADADEFEGRLAFYGNLGCDAPGYNMRLTMPS